MAKVETDTAVEDSGDLAELERLRGENQRLRERVEEFEAREMFRRGTREALRSSREMLARVMDNIPQAIYWKDRDSRYLGCNRHFADMAGFSDPEEIIGKLDEEMPWRARAEAFRAVDLGILGGERGRSVTEGSYTGPFGEGWLRTIKAPLHDAAGAIIGVLGVDEDITDRRRLEEAMQAAITATFSGDGEKFHRALVRHLAQALGMRYAVISEISPDDPGQAQTLAFWDGEGFGENFAYDLEGSPCEHVVGKGVRFFERDLVETFRGFPALAEIGAESYLGAPLFSSDRQPIGIVAVMDTRPMARSAVAESILKVFAARAGAELESRRSERALLVSDARYQRLFEDSPVSLWHEDLSEIKLYFDELRREGVEDFYRHFLANPESVRHCAKLLRVVDVNQATVEIFEAGSKKNLQANVGRIMVGSTYSAVARALGLLASGTTSFEVDSTFRTLEGNEVFVVSRTFVAPGREGDLSEVLVAMTDITERRRTEQQLLEAQASLERRVVARTADLAEAHEDLKSLLYIVSHDLRAPLVNLKGFSEELLGCCRRIQALLTQLRPHLSDRQREELSDALDQDIPEALSFIDSSVNRIDHFMNTLLRLSQEGRRDLVMERIDPAAVAREMLNVLAYQIEQRNASVRVGPLPTVVADRISMEQIFGNLLSNAVLYLDQNRPGEIEVTGEDTGDSVAFHIRDNGVGIPMDDLTKVFQPFRRGRQIEIDGEGMGLAYVQALVRRHGGRIWCESEDGKGSRFSFSLAKNLEEDDDRTSIDLLLSGDGPSES